MIVPISPQKQYRYIEEAMQSLNKRIEKRYPGIYHGLMDWAKRNAPVLRLAVLRGLDEIDKLMEMDVDISCLQRKFTLWSSDLEKLCDIYYRSLSTDSYE